MHLHKRITAVTITLRILLPCSVKYIRSEWFLSKNEAMPEAKIS
jgi:hypothetical protein